MPSALYVGLSGHAPLSAPARICLAGVDRVEIGRAEQRSLRRDGTTVTLALTDPKVSTKHARLSREGTSWVLEDLGSRGGTFVRADRLGKRPLEDFDLALVGATALLFRTDGGDGDVDGEPPAIVGGIGTFAPAFAAGLRALVGARGASNNWGPIELAGGPGTEREAIARALHAASGRTGAFVAVACAAGDLPAIDPAGTVFLDEVGELPEAAQAALLGALGGVATIAASQRDLDAEVAAGRFPAALRERLRGTTAAIPPLRKRPEDLAMHVAAAIRRLAPGRAVALSGDTVLALYAHDWPLDLRELDGSLGAALAAAPAGERVELAHLPTSVGSTEPLEKPAFRPATPEEKALRDTLVKQLAKHHGDVAAIAAELGKDPPSVRGWLRRFGLG